MSNPTSPDVSQEVDEVEDEYDEDQVQQEHFDVGDEEPEDIIDEEIDGEGDVEEDDKQVGQEGLDLDMAEEDGIGYQDEPDGQDELDGLGYQEHGQDEHEDQDEDNNQRDVRASEAAEAEVCDEDEPDLKGLASYQGNCSKEETEVPAKSNTHTYEKLEEKKVDPLSLPEHGSEVFVGNISKDTVEDDLRELCASCGDIFEVRVMRDKEKLDNPNKGFAFVTFTNKEFAHKAIETLNDCELKGRKLRFSPSQLKNKIFIGNIPKNWDRDDLKKALSDKAPGMQNIELLKDPQNHERNRGFAFVEYFNHACADLARRLLSLPGFKLGSNTPTINWAESPTGVDNSSSSQVKVVYVRNLPEGVTQEQLWKLFERHGEITKIMVPTTKPGQQRRDFGFVHFAERSSALKAIEKSEKYVLEGRELEASLAKPTADKKNGAMGHSTYAQGILPQLYQARSGFGFSANDLYGAMAPGFGSNPGYGQVQPVIYGRGPAPAGMAMVPMMLPDGRIGYVLQQPGGDSLPAPYRESRGGSHGHSHNHSNNHNHNNNQNHHRQSGGSGSGSSSRRYRPY